MLQVIKIYNPNPQFELRILGLKFVRIRIANPNRKRKKIPESIVLLLSGFPEHSKHQKQNGCLCQDKNSFHNRVVDRYKVGKQVYISEDKDSQINHLGLARITTTRFCHQHEGQQPNYCHQMGRIPYHPEHVHFTSDNALKG